jgi:hypothetical protein
VKLLRCVAYPAIISSKKSGICWSIELFGKVENQPLLQHVLIIAAGDGYLSISVTDGTVAALRQPLYEDFFNCITVH